MAAERPVDVAHFLPPNLRQAMRARYFPVVRVSLWLLIAGGLIAYRTIVPAETSDAPAGFGDSGARRVTVSGDPPFSLLTEPADQGVRRVLELGGVRYPIVDAEGTSATLEDAAGGAWTARADAEGLHISENDQPRFVFKAGEEGYAVRGMTGDLVYKVKRKEEKINIYGSDAQRLLHGKLKRGDVQWKDEQDAVVLQVSGEDLWSSAVLALPISPQARALGWAMQAVALPAP